MNELRYHVNGDLVPASDATISVRDRGFRYGDAAFETLRAYGGTVFEREAHFERLRRTCTALGIDHGLDDDELHRRVRETLAANNLRDAYVRLSITRGPQPGKLTPAPTTDPGVVVVVDGLPRGGVDGDVPWSGPATAEVVATRRTPDESVPAHAKTHNYLNGILARRETDADEALLHDGNGNVVEGATSNLFVCVDGVLHTPSLDGPVLPGVTREVVRELAAESGIPVSDGSYGERDLREADELFLTNTTWELRPTTLVGGGPSAGGETTARLRNAFDRRVEREHYE